MKKLYLATDIVWEWVEDKQIYFEDALILALKKGLLAHKKIYELKRVTRKELLEK